MNSLALADPCRLCGAETRPQFSMCVLGRHDVRCAECERCGSLQTEPPHWLGECYAEDVSPHDSGYLTRNLHYFARVALLGQVLGLPKSAPIFDFGGGLGVLARLLSEAGRRAYSDDAFSTTPFGVEAPTDLRPVLVTAIEVFEHLANPAADLENVFRHSPDYVFVSTEQYLGQREDWWYLSPQTGQHVFFYSARAMQFIADRFGYRALRMSDRETLFSKSPLPLTKRLVLRMPVFGIASRFLGAWRVLRRGG